MLDLSRNDLRGALPVAWGQLDSLGVLNLAHNSLTGPLPQSLTGLRALGEFYFDNTELCAPCDSAFQAWLRGIDDIRGANCPPDATEQQDGAAVESPAIEVEQHFATPAELAEVQAKLKGEIGELKAELRALELRLIRRLDA